MIHRREDIIERIRREFELLDAQIAKLGEADWQKPVPRPETKDPWTVKDALVHITYWKANTARSIRKQRRPAEERGLELNDLNHLIYTRWRDRSPQEALQWHRQVQEDVLSALREAPEEYFSGKEHSHQWPFDLDGHSAEHRRKDIGKAIGE
jgi:hypothetical protein